MFKLAMRRFFLVTSLLLYAAALTAVITPTASAATRTPPRAKVTTRCQTSPKAAKRRITADATMRPVTGTQKLAIEFWLQGKVNGAGTYETLPTLGVWKSPQDPTTLGQNPADVWHIKQAVALLAPGDTYRFEVKFRWYGKGTTVLKNKTLYSQACVQPTAAATTAS